MEMEIPDNAAVPEQYPEFARLVGYKLWPAVKGRLCEEELKSLIANPEEVMLRLRKSFTEKQECRTIIQMSPFFA